MCVCVCVCEVEGMPVTAMVFTCVVFTKCIRTPVRPEAESLSRSEDGDRAADIRDSPACSGVAEARQGRHG